MSLTESAASELKGALPKLVCNITPVALITFLISFNHKLLALFNNSIIIKYFFYTRYV